MFSTYPPKAYQLVSKCFKLLQVKTHHLAVGFSLDFESFEKNSHVRILFIFILQPWKQLSFLKVTNFLFLPPPPSIKPYRLPT